MGPDTGKKFKNRKHCTRLHNKMATARGRFIKLNGSIWTVWKFLILIVLDCRGLKKYVDGNELEPEEPESDEETAKDPGKHKRAKA